MVINTSEQLSETGEMLKAFSEAISDLLSNKNKFNTMIEGFFDEHVSKVRSEFKVLDYNGEISNFIQKEIFKLDGKGSSGNYLRFSNDIYRDLDHFFETTDKKLKPIVDKLFEVNKLKIVWDYKQSIFKVVRDGEFHGFYDFDVTTLVTISKKAAPANKRYELTKKILDFMVCEDDKLDEKAKEVLNLLEFNNFKARIKKRVMTVYDKNSVDVRNLFEKIDFDGLPFAFCLKDVAWIFSEVEYILDQQIRGATRELGINKSFYSEANYSPIMKRQSVNLNLVLKELFSDSNQLGNPFSENIAVNRFASDIPGLENLRPERDDVLLYCRRFLIGDISDDERNGESKLSVIKYLVEAYSIDIEELLNDWEIELVLQKFVEIDKSYLSLRAEELLLRSVRTAFKNSGVQTQTNNPFSNKKAEAFFIKNKEYIKSELKKIDNSTIKSPIIRFDFGGYNNFLDYDLLSLKSEFLYYKNFLDVLGIQYNPTINIDTVVYEEKDLSNKNREDLIKFATFTKLLLSDKIIDKIILSCRVSFYDGLFRKIFSEEEFKSIDFIKYPIDDLSKYSKSSENLKLKTLSYSNFLNLSRDDYSWIRELLK